MFSTLAAITRGALLVGVTVGGAAVSYQEVSPASHTTTDDPTASPKATTPAADVEALARKCLELYKALPRVDGGPAPTQDQIDAVKAACTQAMEASGLTGDAFWAKFRPKEEPKPAEPTKRPKPEQTANPIETKPTDKPSTTISTLVATCLKLGAALGDDASAERIHAVREACGQAMRATAASH